MAHEMDGCRALTPHHDIWRQFANLLINSRICVGEAQNLNVPGLASQLPVSVVDCHADLMGLLRQDLRAKGGNAIAESGVL
jgi:hypothetical protein